MKIGRVPTWVLGLLALIVMLGTPALDAGATSPTPPEGQILFSDDFGSTASGWTTTPLPSGALFAYGLDEYRITPAPGQLDTAQAPYREGHFDLIQSVDVRFPAGPTGAEEGGGVACGRPDIFGAHYQFVLRATGAWFISRRDKQNEGYESVIGGILHRATFGPGATASLVAECRTQGTGADSSTHLSLFIQGAQVADLEDPFTTSAETGGGAGWLPPPVTTLSRAWDSPTTRCAPRCRWQPRPRWPPCTRRRRTRRRGPGPASRSSSGWR